MPPRINRFSLSHVMQRLDGAPVGDSVPTGFPSLDKVLGGGVRRGDLVVLGGDVGSGKSSLALGMVLRAAKAGRGAAFLSGEMTVERVLERALAIEGRARIDDLRAGTLDDETRAAVGAVAVRLRDEAPLVERLPVGGTEELREWFDRALDLELVIVDPLQVLATRSDAQDEELAAAVRQLKSVAIDRHLAIVIAAHLPNLDRQRKDLRPTLDDLGVLGAAKQHADIVLGLFREELYDATAGNEGAAELAVLKNRNGTTGYVDLYFYKRWLRFEDVLEP